MMQNIELKCLSALLCYPEIDLIQSIDDIRLILNEKKYPKLTHLFEYLSSTPLIQLQENYVATFDNNRRHALYIFEHVYGEDRDRGSAMVDLLEEYQRCGFELGDEELPDYLPVLLEFFSCIPHAHMLKLLGDAVHVIEHIHQKLIDSQSPYAAILEVVVDMSPVRPKPLVEPPIRDMDEAMETFGPDYSGIEPLLKNQNNVIQFYRN